MSYFGLAATSPELLKITGLGSSAIVEILQRLDHSDTSRRHHIGVVAAVVERLAAGRAASTGSGLRRSQASDWLTKARISTSRGDLSPLEILADADLAKEALDDLMR
jgi:hypothetical protein